MKEYVFVLLMLAGMITLVAVAFGAVVYLKYKFGRDTLKFELSRIAITWAAVIALLLMVGCLILTVAGWTSENVAAAFGDVLEWAHQNRIMSEIILWGVTILLIALLVHLNVFTFSSFVIISLLHIWATYAIWNSETAAPWQFIWMFIKVFLAIVIAAEFDDCDAFDSIRRHRQNPDDECTDTSAQPISAQSQERDISQSAIEVVAETIAEHVEPIVQTVQN